MLNQTIKHQTKTLHIIRKRSSLKNCLKMSSDAQAQNM